MVTTKQTAILAGGCFWCIESVYSQLKGVSSATSGYVGGETVSPTYEEVCSGSTGHAEAVKIEFDANIISYSTLLDVFFAIHDPTQLNRQGGDIGTQYRSAIFYLNEEQQHTAKQKISEYAQYFDAPIVTQIVNASHFFNAEDYHQGYFLKNPDRPGYCQMVVSPKFSKARIKFSELWKD